MYRVGVIENVNKRSQNIIEANLGGVAEIIYKTNIYDIVPAKEIIDMDAIILGDAKVTKETIVGANKLRVIGRLGVGIDNIDTEACKQKGIVVVNTPGENAISVAEHVFGLILAVSRRLTCLDKLIREGRWKEKIKYEGIELFGKTIGIIGMGAIGKEVMRIALGFGMNVLYNDIEENKNIQRENVMYASLESVLSKSDIVTLHVPLTQKTYHLINREKIKLMKQGAILINTARGAIVDEDALYDALSEGLIGGAGIDVYTSEPLYTHKFFKLENVVLTPHVGDFTKEAQDRILMRVCSEIKKYLIFDSN
ncbi:hydroxyacid dehydrogenase [Thermoanaerobacter wiegelii]|uniref:NAD-binding D-isomer specific 2-hydroxyacid dehydrogenase n=1 Tax=Thermoanaerobacter wiegelii Rt8.B1 TaxID=697303 RepID=G2MUV9_9THEO|nr:hydroxyacid dehydrogenase [Thermoanaerobacter wiegelii]AEM77860.1 NAD-binding D-isomer specific 2-hydroxyacid dehydrogenase [Thermoanaerobacter wiegelii Rt8.B1]